MFAWATGPPLRAMDNYPSVVPPEEELPDDEERTGYDDDDGHYGHDYHGDDYHDDYNVYHGYDDHDDDDHDDDHDDDGHDDDHDDHGQEDDADDGQEEEEEDDDSVDAPPPQDVPTPQPGATLDSPIDFTQEAADDARGRPRRRGAGEIDGYCPARIAALPQHAHKRARLE